MINNDVKAIAKRVPIAPRKIRLVIDLIRDKSIEEAQAILDFTNKSAAIVVSKLLKSAVSNAVNNFNFNINNLYVKKIFVNQGVRMKRLLPRAKGRSNQIQKNTSHITIFVASNESESERKVVSSGSKE
ncbi:MULTISPECIES: 50S ribosomal protein L22 [Candidatus Phytoplasma]|uniref:Large ribosomal subunit protein uL22 n=6 Tax=Candidatus Phytoplasma TaxID=33926 RepID=A4GMR7_9MOLU|nr:MULTISPECIES: 50S ribosomal protein L22 [Phytoplasma]ABO26513.1 ribosomal protein L22 [Peanut witches'-broom phytoplasma]ABO26515.1 ribosomal protein L22 [Sweet potato witches'-broom phytoplasma]APA21460.1 ribosomal protein L22 ['Corchorus aestuans' phyllody phytoplasma]APA21463.1 ribosomal protein L22 ['Spermacoce exilis' phyllody phytoplasma]WBR79249.1 ribosomal protein L22 [Candidatus Phytoplasma aurantifolia]WKV64027.1 MAG: 50S ribosomal protein L22 [Candidatus Phytoplasma australasiat